MLSTLQPYEWDAAVVSYPQHSFLQSYDWGEFQKKHGRNVERYCIRHCNGRYAIAQILSHPLPFFGWYGYCPRGPLMEEGQNTSFLASLSAELRKQRALFLRIEPPTFTPTVKGIVQIAPMQPADVWIVDLSQPFDVLQSLMHPKTRYNYRIAQKKGISIQMISSPYDNNFEKAISDFIGLLARTAGRHQFRLHTDDYYRQMITFFIRNLSESKTNISLRLYAAYRGATPLAAILVLYFGSTATFLHGGSDYRFRHLMAPYALHMQAIQDAAELGFTSYDMGGIAHTDDPHDSWQGITRFKKGFSGYSLHYPGTFDIVFNSFHYLAYSKFRQVRSRLRSSMDRT
ncbi:peptidoglycan bridge formation glycyltransferase FemA/FemB family protein [Candidatus Uhrbacteria bacterium]|nr:peptidoglycan bridge formation glycyltransferase FemA/FemB family protein [Candidatus Uhrbacteria bacterium]